MTDAVVHLSNAAFRHRGFATPLGRSLYRATIAQGTRLALDELPDNLLRDIGITRGDIPFVAGELAFGDKDQTRDALDRPDRTVARRGVAARRLSHAILGLAIVAVAAVLTLVMLSRSVHAQDAQIGRCKPASFVMKIAPP